MEKQKVYVIGPSLKTMGGISSVLKIYKENYKSTHNMVFIPSYLNRRKIRNYFYFLAAVIRTILVCVFTKSAVFHLHTSSNGSFLRKSIIARICMLFGKGFIMHVHGSKFDCFIENSSPKKRQRIIAILNNADKVVALSNWWKEFLKKYVPEEKLTLIYNPSEVCDSDYVRRVNQTPNILFMGRLGERKGTYDLIEAAKRINVNFVLNLYGDGDVDEIGNIVAKDGLNEKISVKGWIDHRDIDKVYYRSDILVLPSYAEGLPMSILEAMGRGMPIVSTPVGGIPEAVIDGENGYLVEAGDVDGLAIKLKALLADTDLRERMGKRSLEIVREKFSTEVIAIKLQLLYSEVFSRVSARRTEGQVQVKETKVAD